MDREQYKAEKIADIRRGYLRDIQPLLKQQARLYSLTVPRVIVYDDGRIENTFVLSDELKQTEELIQECIKQALEKANESIAYYL